MLEKPFINEISLDRRKLKFNNYNILRNQITSMIRKGKRKLYNDAIKHNKAPSYICTSLKSASNKKKGQKHSNVSPKVLYVIRVRLETRMKYYMH